MESQIKFSCCCESLLFHSCKDDNLYSKNFSVTFVKNMVDVNSYEKRIMK